MTDQKLTLSDHATARMAKATAKNYQLQIDSAAGAAVAAGGGGGGRIDPLDLQLRSISAQAVQAAVRCGVVTADQKHGDGTRQRYTHAGVVVTKAADGTVVTAWKNGGGVRVTSAARAKASAVVQADVRANIASGKGLEKLGRKAKKLNDKEADKALAKARDKKARKKRH